MTPAPLDSPLPLLVASFRRQIALRDPIHRDCGLLREICTDADELAKSGDPTATTLEAECREALAVAERIQHEARLEHGPLANAQFAILARIRQQPASIRRPSLLTRVKTELLRIQSSMRAERAERELSMRNNWIATVDNHLRHIASYESEVEQFMANTTPAARVEALGQRVEAVKNVQRAIAAEPRTLGVLRRLALTIDALDDARRMLVSLLDTGEETARPLAMEASAAQADWDTSYDAWADELASAARPPELAIGARGSFTARYKAGEHEQVWRELSALGPRVRDGAAYEDALEVARETMQRARCNIDRVAERLAELGYAFDTPSRILPSAADLEAIARFEREVGPLPLSLRACLEIVGGVSFVQAEDQLQQLEDLHSRFIDLANLGLEDPLELPAGRFLAASRGGEVPLFMEDCLKAGFSGDYVYAKLPAAGADFPIISGGDDGEPFIGYLRASLRRGGFRGHTCTEAESDAFGRGYATRMKTLGVLREDLIPF